MGSKMKICTACKKPLPLESFSKASNQKSGYKCRCKECTAEYYKSYYAANIYKENTRCSIYKKTNRKKIREYDSNYQKQRREADPIYKLRHNIRTRFTKLFNGKSKSFSGLSALGCTLEFFKQYIENQFEPGMSWNNYGWDTWHIDHIVPLDSANSEEEIFKLWHYTNLRPMYAIDNWKKGSKVL